MGSKTETRDERVNRMARDAFMGIQAKVYLETNRRPVGDRESSLAAVQEAMREMVAGWPPDAQAAFDAAPDGEAQPVLYDAIKSVVAAVLAMPDAPATPSGTLH